MPLTDLIGKNLAVGQLVHVHLNGTFTAEVVEISDSKLLVAGSAPMPPLVSLAVQFVMPISNDKCGVYIVQDAIEAETLKVVPPGDAPMLATEPEAQLDKSSNIRKFPTL